MAEENDGNWWNQSGQPQGDSQNAPTVDTTSGDTSSDTSSDIPSDILSDIPSDTSSDILSGGQQDGVPPVSGDNTSSDTSSDTSVNTEAGSQFTMSGDQPTEAIPTSPSSDSTSADTTTVSADNVPDDRPDYSAAPHETYTTQYRPAPQYGAYGPTPTQPEQPAEQQYNQPNQQNQQMPPQGNNNPYFGGNPFMANAQNNDPNAGQQNPYAPQEPGPQGPSGPQGPVFTNSPFENNGNGKKKKGGTVAVQSVIVAIVAAVVTAVLCLCLGYFAVTEGWVTLPSSSSLADIDSNQSGSGSATVDGDSVDWVTVAANVSDSVVAIQTVVDGGTAAGSGAILDTEGHIVTNNHVISGATSIQVTLSNGQIYSAEVVGTDSTTDLAVIKLEDAPDDLTPVEFADSDDLAVGEAVMAIGNPLGYADTATTGIVSALNRPVSVVDDDNTEIVTNAVQIDAAINPGNSGGPTFNAAGQVIGINSSIASTASSSDEAGSIGIGFAIPSNLVKRISEEIIEDGEATHVALGVTITSTTVEADGVTRSGALITASSSGSAVVSGSPADEAGLEEGDTIVAYNGNAVSSSYSLLGYVRAAALDDTVTLTIVRNGSTMDIEVTLDQEEAAVNGTSSDDDDDNSSSQQQDQEDGGDDSSGGFYDPFGLW